MFSSVFENEGTPVSTRISSTAPSRTHFVEGKNSNSKNNTFGEKETLVEIPISIESSSNLNDKSKRGKKRYLNLAKLLFQYRYDENFLANSIVINLFP